MKYQLHHFLYLETPEIVLGPDPAFATPGPLILVLFTGLSFFSPLKDSQVEHALSSTSFKNEQI